MSFSQPHTATWVDLVRDDYNSVTETETSFNCMIEEDTQFLSNSGQPVEIGKGIIFTMEELAFRTGDKVIINSETFAFIRVSRLGDDGAFHHYELIYG